MISAAGPEVLHRPLSLLSPRPHRSSARRRHSRHTPDSSHRQTMAPTRSGPYTVDGVHEARAGGSDGGHGSSFDTGTEVEVDPTGIRRISAWPDGGSAEAVVPAPAVESVASEPVDWYDTGGQDVAQVDGAEGQTGHTNGWADAAPYVNGGIRATPRRRWSPDAGAVAERPRREPHDPPMPPRPTSVAEMLGVPDADAGFTQTPPEMGAPAGDVATDAPMAAAAMAWPEPPVEVAHVAEPPVEVAQVAAEPVAALVEAPAPPAAVAPAAEAVAAPPAEPVRVAVPDPADKDRRRPPRAHGASTPASPWSSHAARPRSSRRWPARSPRATSSSTSRCPLGFTPLDKTIGGGIRAGELLLIGGAQGTGKTTMARPDGPQHRHERPGQRALHLLRARRGVPAQPHHRHGVGAGPACPAGPAA